MVSGSKDDVAGDNSDLPGARPRQRYNILQGCGSNPNNFARSVQFLKLKRKKVDMELT